MSIAVGLVMSRLLSRGRIRAAIGLIAAYAIALQTLFAALAPLPVNAQGADFAGWHILCFGSGSTTTDSGNPDAPAPVSGKFHCVLCGSVASAAILPGPVTAVPAPAEIVSAVLFAPAPDLALAWRHVRAGSARAPPLTV